MDLNMDVDLPFFLCGEGNIGTFNGEYGFILFYMFQTGVVVRCSMSGTHLIEGLMHVYVGGTFSPLVEVGWCFLGVRDIGLDG